MNDLDVKDLLTRELRERSAEVDGSPISLDRVRHSARGIRRRRQAVAGAAAAVVAGVTVPTGVMLTASPDGGPVEDPVVATSPGRATPSADGPVPLTLEGLETGAPPLLPYFTPAGLVTPEGLLETDLVLQAVERRSDGWIGLGYSDPGRGAQVFFLDEEFQPWAAERSGEQMAANADGSLVAFTVVEDDGTQTLTSAERLDAMTWSFPARPALEPVGYVGPGEVVYELTQGGRVEAGIAHPDGTTTAIEGFLGVADASEANGLIAGQTGVTDDLSACSGVMDPARSTSTMVFETCEYQLHSFSPDGRYLLASDAQGDGMGWRDLTVLDVEEDFAPVVEYDQPRNGQVALVMTAWESDSTLLSVASEGTSTAIIRLGLDGRLERAVDPVRGDVLADLPFWFSRSDL